MKWQLNELAVDNNQKMYYDFEVNFTLDDFINIERLKNVETFFVKGFWYYNELEDHLYTEFNLMGNIVIFDAITLKERKVLLDIETTEVFGFDQLDDISDYLIEDNSVDLEPIIKQLIVANIPLKVVVDDQVYPKGIDWEVISEEQFNKRVKPVNPKMAKLLQIDIEDE